MARNHIFITGRKVNSLVSGGNAASTSSVGSAASNSTSPNSSSSTSSNANTQNPYISEISLTQHPQLISQRIKFMLSGIYHNFLVTENDYVVTWGKNHFGQLGMGDKEDRGVLTKWNALQLNQNTNNNTTATLQPQEVSPTARSSDLSSLHSQNTTTTASSSNAITHISGRACFVGWVLNNRKVYMHGLNNFGQAGTGHQNNLERPTLLRIRTSSSSRPANAPAVPPAGNPVTRFDDAASTSADSTNATTPTDHTLQNFLQDTIDDGREIKILCCAGVHTILMLSDGTMYSWGYSAYGQTCQGTKTDTYTPQPLTFFQERNLTVEDVVCGDYHSIFVVQDPKHGLGTEGKTLYSGGKNGSGQLGLNGTTPRTLPEEITFFRGKNITHVSCGENHTIVVVDSIEVYGFGTNSRGQCGLGEMNNQALAPTRITLPTQDPIKLLQCGRNFTILVTTYDEVVVFGDNSSQQLAFDHTVQKYIKTPTLMKFPHRYSKPITNVSCGEYHALFLVSDIPQPQEKTPVDALRNMIDEYDEERHSHLFDGEIICHDKTVRVFQSLVKKRCPPLFASSDAGDSNPKTCTVNFNSDTLGIILYYVYTDRLPSFLEEAMESTETGDSSKIQSCTSSIGSSRVTLKHLVTLYAWLEENQDCPVRLRALLLRFIIGKVNDGNVCELLIHLDHESKHSNQLRKHLLAHLKSKIDKNAFDRLPENEHLSQSLLREILTRGGKETLLRSSNIMIPNESTLKEDMAEILEDDEEGDITIYIGPSKDKFLRVHKCVLAFAVKKYMAQFTGGFRDQSITEIDLFEEFSNPLGGSVNSQDVNSSALTNSMTEEEEQDLTDLLTQFVYFLYTGTLEITATNAVSIINLWDTLSMKVDHEIYRSCIKVIMHGIDESNVLEILKLFLPEKGHLFPDLERKCHMVCATNWEKLNDLYGDEIMNSISYSQYVSITRRYMLLKSEGRG